MDSRSSFSLSLIDSFLFLLFPMPPLFDSSDFLEGILLAFSLQPDLASSWEGLLPSASGVSFTRITIPDGKITISPPEESLYAL